MVSKSQVKATNNYKRKNYKRIGLELKKEYYESVLLPAVQKSGESVNGFIKKAIADRIEKGK